jgi:hypothetical protein
VIIAERLYGSDDNSAYSSPGKFHKNAKARAELVQVGTFLCHTNAPPSPHHPTRLFFRSVLTLKQRLNKNASKYGYLRRPFAWTAHRLFKRGGGGALRLSEGCTQALLGLDGVHGVLLAQRDAMTAGAVTLNHFWSISNDSSKPFDLFSAIRSKFDTQVESKLQKPKPDAAAVGSRVELVKIEGNCSFCVREWHEFCRTNIRSGSLERPAMAVTLFDTTRSGMSHSNPSVSIFDSTHVIEVRPTDCRVLMLVHLKHTRASFTLPIDHNPKSSTTKP